MDSKAAFQSFVNQYKITCPCISSDEGGIKLRDAVKSYGGGGTRLIKPDRTYKTTNSYMYENDLISAGIKPHTCVTKIDNINTYTTISDCRITKINKSTLQITVPSSGEYSIIFYSLKGHKKTLLLSQQLSIGSNIININTNKLSNQCYISEIKNKNFIIRQKVVVK